MKLTLPTDSTARKDVPVLSGCVNYFPAALAWIARISLRGDRKHNPENAGNPPFHARDKSMDHGDCIVRHTMDIEDIKAHIARESDKSAFVIGGLLEEAAYRAWRACAELQELCEKYDNAPLAPAARLNEAVKAYAAPQNAEMLDLPVDIEAKFTEVNKGITGNTNRDVFGPGIDATLEADEQEARRVRDMKNRLALDKML